ncbi:hypothetical protein [Pseudomonas kurunegalensis]|uniref:hypothetical protein n=1 Tax=Pseudomonas kurunegalensis TaxID=485880 RepID=UPI002363A4D7|nr:hypothetical protein [Pseudomonas kurunegalensis]MDD2135655.1 hypothetical protein [Pseudomonas kurunegalensis]
MAGLWEPVGGVFWSAPPDVGWAHWPTVIVLLVATAACTTLAVRIVKKRSEPEWHLRQHMVEVGGAFTLVYLVGIIALTGDRIGTLGDMPLNEVGDFLAGAFGPVAFLWLVLGFLQQGEELKQGTEALLLQATELKNSVEQQSIMAAAATQQIDAQQEVLELQRYERDRAVMANFAIYTVSSASQHAGMQLNRFRIASNGNRATDLSMTFEPPIPSPYIVTIAEVGAGNHVDYKFIFRPEKCPRKGAAQITYVDTEGGHRTEHFTFTLNESEMKLIFKKARQLG